jgi:membrane associated rhomboid family serine protease
MSAARKRSLPEVSLHGAWLTLGLAALAVLAFVGTQGFGVSARAARAAALERPAAYWAEHPYLEAPPEVIAKASALGLESATFDAGDAGMIPTAQLAREQAKLTDLVEALGSAERSSTAYRFAFDPRAPRPLGLAAHVLVHGGTLALLFNLALLLALGPRLEAALGRAVFALVYLGAGVAGAVGHVAAAAVSSAPLLGGFAASAGLCAAFALGANRAPRDPFAELLGSAAAPPAPAASLRNRVAVAAVVSLAGIALGGGLAASLAGFAFGACAALGLGRAGLIRGAASEPLSAPVFEALAALAAGDTAGAVEMLRGQLESGADDPQLARALTHALRTIDASGANAQLAEALGVAVARKKRQTAIALWRELGASGAAPRGRPDVLMTLATWLRSAREPGEARLCFLLALRDADAASAAKLARELRRSDPSIALRAAERALSQGTPEAAERRALEELAREARRAAEANGLAALDAALEARSAVEIGAAPAEARPPRSAAPEPKAAVSPLPFMGADLEPEHEPLLESDADRQAEPARPAPSSEHFDHDARDLSLDDAPSAELPDPEVSGNGSLVDALHAALMQDAAELEAQENAPTQTAAGAPDDGDPFAGLDAVVQSVADAARSSVGAEPPIAQAELTVYDPELALDADTPEPSSAEAEPPVAQAELTVYDPELALDVEKPEPAPPPLRRLRISAAKPLALEQDALVLDIEGRGKGRLDWSKIDAIAAVGVSGISKSGRTVLMIDLAIGFAAASPDLRVVRVRADAFDPRRLMPGHASPLAALRALVAELRRRTRAVPLPREVDANAPFRIYPDLASYAREVLGAETRAA